MSILVVGSFMMDQVVTTSKVPAEGETVIGESFSVNPGGKGANQAVAAKRLGAKVKMLGKLGGDSNGETFIRVFENEGIDIEDVKIDANETTGIGFITKELNGDNRIIVVSGANMAYTYEEFKETLPKLDSVSLAIFQLEMNFSVTQQIIETLYHKQIPIILNPAPAKELPKELLKYITYLTPNETELGILTNRTIVTQKDVEDSVDELLEMGVDTVVVTLGDKGAYYANKHTSGLVEAIAVKPVDTVAAGDSFNGALAVAITEGKTLEEAIKFANKVGSLTVTKIGAISSLPYRKDVE